MLALPPDVTFIDLVAAVKEIRRIDSFQSFDFFSIVVSVNN